MTRFGLITALLVLAVAPGAAQTDDEAYVQSLMNQVLESEKTAAEVPWQNEDTGSRGVVVVERTYYLDPDTPCRDYRRTLERPGGPLVVEGTGCRIGPNDWNLDEQALARAAATPLPGAAGGAPATAAETAPSCPPVELPNVLRVPCGKPVPFADYTMPSKAEL